MLEVFNNALVVVGTTLVSVMALCACTMLFVCIDGILFDGAVRDWLEDCVKSYLNRRANRREQ